MKKIQELKEIFICRLYSICEEFFRWKEKLLGCYDYFKFIWQNDTYREWDFEYLYDFIAFKLKRMARQLEGYPEEYTNTTSQEINEALKALEDFKYTCYAELNDESIEEKLDKRQSAWNKFHDILKENAQNWWD